MITFDHVVGKWADSCDLTAQRVANITGSLLPAVNHLLAWMIGDGITPKINPATRTYVSGQQYGGFRPQSCPEGAPHSAHKEGLAVDLYDPDGAIDAWCLTNLDKLEGCGIYIEHPDATRGWSHWTTRAPASGRRVFHP